MLDNNVNMKILGTDSRQRKSILSEESFKNASHISYENCSHAMLT